MQRAVEDVRCKEFTILKNYYKYLKNYNKKSVDEVFVDNFARRTSYPNKILFYERFHNLANVLNISWNEERRW